MNLPLSNALGADAKIEDSAGVGTIRDACDAFTAEFQQAPASHDGSAKFTFRLKFSEEIAQGTKRNLFRAISGTGVDMKRVLRVDNRLDLFEFTFEPKGDDDVTVALGPSTTD